MVLNRIYVLPHGDEILDIPDRESEKMNSVISRLASDDDSDVIVIASPHGVRLSRNVPVVNTEWFHGTFQLKTMKLERKLRNERQLAESILSSAREEAEEVGFVTAQGEKSIFPLDFGALIPLEFFPERPIVYLGQSRLRDRKKLLTFGEALYSSINEYKGKVSLIISADQAHTHSSEGPYGYSNQARMYEEIVVKCITDNDYSPLLTMDEEMISAAKPDSYWNLVTLSSILRKSGRKLELDYHYVEVYFGMLCAHSF